MCNDPKEAVVDTSKLLKNLSSCNIGVFGTTMYQARTKLVKLSETLPRKDILNIRLSQMSGQSIIDMKNGDRYIAVFPSDNVRGYRWKQVYVPYNIDLDIFYDVIYPKIISDLPEHEWVVGYWF